jgi:hypothetical protein
MLADAEGLKQRHAPVEQPWSVEHVPGRHS